MRSTTEQEICTILQGPSHQIKWEAAKTFYRIHLRMLMKFFSRGLNLHSGIERVDATRSIPETWASHSMRNIQESQGDDDDDKHDDNHE